MLRILRHLAYEGPRHHRPTILTDRCAPPDTTPTTTAHDADTTPAWLTEWTSGSGLPMHSPSRHATRTTGPRP